MLRIWRLEMRQDWMVIRRIREDNADKELMSTAFAAQNFAATHLINGETKSGEPGIRFGKT